MLTNGRALLPPIWPIRGPDWSHKARGRVDKLVTGLPSDYGPEQIDIVRPGTGAECDQSRGQESHVAQFRQEADAIRSRKNSPFFNFSSARTS